MALRHRDRRRDEAVAEEQRRAEQADRADRRPQSPVATRHDSSVLSASTPPSPRLSARSTIVTYLTEMTSISDQRISDSRPSTLASLTAMP